MEILDGRKVAGQILTELKSRVEKLKQSGVQPKLTAFNVGDHKPSKVYLAAKGKRAAEVGIGFELVQFSAKIEASQIISRLKQVNESDASGIIFQLPLPQELSSHHNEILNSIDPNKDVDLLTDKSRQLLEQGHPIFTPPTAGAILAILDAYNIDLAAHRILLVGRGELVGKPLTQLLKIRGLDFEIMGRDTPNSDELLASATLIISATGKAGIISADKISESVIIVDAGTAESAGKVVGDVDPSAYQKASFVSPVPGGVGPVTVAMLLSNVVQAAERAVSAVDSQT